LFYQASSLRFAQLEFPREILKLAFPDFCVSVKTPSHNSVWGRQQGRAELLSNRVPVSFAFRIEQVNQLCQIRACLLSGDRAAGARQLLEMMQE
jgi:hypothetical protein